MASSIISDTIDGAYPVAGIDNDTQGFRDNFTIIKTGLATATSEITTLQNTTAKLNETNDFNGTEITDANFSLNTEKYHNIGTVISGQNISFLNGHHQSLAINLGEDTPSIAFALADWPARDHLAKMTVQLFGNDTAKTVTFTNPYKSVNYAVGITAEDMATGDFFTVSNKTINGFDVLFKNSSGTNVSRTFDFIAKGF